MIEVRFTQDACRLTRTTVSGDLRAVTSLNGVAPFQSDEWAQWWQSWLKGAVVEREQRPSGAVRVVDLFCGCGGLSLGARMAAEALGIRFRSKAAVDTDKGALDVVQYNLGYETALCEDAELLVDYSVDLSAEDLRYTYPPELLNDALARLVGNVDLLLAGPPCQGHSNLNNRTRRADPRNSLFLSAVSVGIALRARGLLIENVPTVVADRHRVVQIAEALLGSEGYRTAQVVLDFAEFGFPQRRRRFFLVAVHERFLPSPELSEEIGYALREELKALHVPTKPVSWALEDLLDAEASSMFDSPSRLSRENAARVEYLFRNELYDLPNHMRPACHRDGHTYPSVYGRMRWDKPAQTITTGFTSPGRGRFIHPLAPRAITPHEAARLQGFPDSFSFTCGGSRLPSRSDLAKWIGDAVPPPLAHAVALWLLPKVYFAYTDIRDD